MSQELADGQSSISRAVADRPVCASSAQPLLPLLKTELEKIRKENTSTVHGYYVQVAALQRCRLPHIIAGPAAGILIIDSLMIPGPKYQMDGPCVGAWLAMARTDRQTDRRGPRPDDMTTLQSECT